MIDDCVWQLNLENKGMNDPSYLLQYKRNVFSQSGEDGVIEMVLETLPHRDHWCVEVGAWDGVSLSNTRYLIKEKGYSAVLIEGDKQRFASLQKNCMDNPKISTINRFVGFSKSDNLDAILNETTCPIEFDLLSIDIDGNDYHCWKAIEKYEPKIVCVEFNPTIPPNVDFVQVDDVNLNQGSSLSSFVGLAKQKGYELVAALSSNAIFVNGCYFPAFDITRNDAFLMWKDQANVTYFFSGYDGTIFLRGCRKLPWHKLDLSEQRFQRLPRFLRRYPGNYKAVHFFAFSLFLLLTDPRRFALEAWRRLTRRQSTFE